MKRTLFIAALAAAVGCTIFTLPFFFSRTVPTNDVAALRTKQLGKLHYLGVAIQQYQAEHGTSAWPDWMHLLEFGGPDVKTQFGEFIDPETGKSLPWFYMPEGKPTAEGRVVLIAAPLPRPADAHSKGKELRAVLWSDFRAGYVDEAEFQQRIKDAAHLNPRANQ